MENFRRDIILYAHSLVEERFGDDPERLDAFVELAQQFVNNPNFNLIETGIMIHQMFGQQDQDLGQLYMHIVQEQYDPASRLLPPVIQAARLIKLATMCRYTQIRDLCHQRWPIQAPIHAQLSLAVNLFIADQITEAQLRAQLAHELREFPDFHSEIQARVDRITSLFRGVAAGNNPGAGNPPPQA